VDFTKSDYTERVNNAHKSLGEFDALFVNNDANLRYFTGVDSGKLLIWKGGAKFWLKDFYIDLAKNSYVQPDAYEKDAIKDFIFAKKFKKIGIDPVTLHEYQSIEPKLRKLLKPADVCEDLRKIKSKKEIVMLEKAGKIAADSVRILEESRLIGMTEFELAASIECNIRASGSERPPFSQGMLCASGPNTKYPHAFVSGRKIQDGDVIVLDLGAVYKGYHSDMTRTLTVGNVSKDKQNLADFIEVLKDRAIDKIEVGGKISDIHTFIEEETKQKGYEVAHLSGHGVGLAIHEKPSIGPTEEDVFQNGMVFTIEPGIYTTSFGVRSEDTVALIGGKTKILTA
jgi:Xaa-Pro dipeptidase